MTDDADWLAREFGYRISDDALLARALTHRSAAGRHNERLEFLGDAALGVVIAEALYHRLPEASEGHLSRLRASLVRRATLAEIARDKGFAERLRLGAGELKSGGFRRASILADAFEAVLGAVFIDGGIEAVRAVVVGLFEERLENPPAHEALKDPKTLLQERLQARGLPLPRYRLAAVQGEDHRQQFTIACMVEGVAADATGFGSSRRAAEQAAAARMLARLDD